MNKKRLKFIITLGTGKFGSSENDQITLEGYRAIADIDKAGGMMMGTLRARIYGVSQSDMNSITTLRWKPQENIFNTADVYAIDGDKETMIFAGNIVDAWGDYQTMPDVYLRLQAQAAYRGKVEPVPPRSFKGNVDVAVAIAQIAKDLGYTFENNGVSVILTDVYIPNTNIEQIKDLAHAANIDWYLDDKVLAITPKNQPRGGLIPEISAESGLIGYPTFDGIGVNFQTIFNPSIVFGGRIKITSDIKQAAGEWIVTSIKHRLESEKPGGAWLSQIQANANGLAITH